MSNKLTFKESTINDNTKTAKSHIIVDEKYDLASINIQPSRELLDFYRRKVSELTADHDVFIRRIEQMNEVCQTQYKLNNDLKQREEEISDLQKALSDMQVYLFKEREQVLRLYAENDRLKIRELDDRKKIQQLLQLSGLTQSEVTYFIKEPPSKAVVQPNSAVTLVTSDGFSTSIGSSKKSGQTLKNVNNNSKGDTVTVLEHDAIKRELDSYKIQIQALQSQMEEQTRLNKEQIDALMEDRRIRQEEMDTQQRRDNERIQELSDKLKRTQELLYENTKEFLTQRHQYKEKEKECISDRDKIFRKLQLKESSLANLSKENKFPTSAFVTETQSLQTKAWTAWNDQITIQKEEQYRNSIKQLEYQLEQQIKLSEMYREQVIEMENELSQIREEEDATKDIYKKRSLKINNRLQLMNQRYKDLERRRNLEVQGFQTDIANLRKKLKLLEKQLYTVMLGVSDQMSYNNSVNIPDNLDLAVLREVKETAKRSNHLSGQLKDLKAMMYGLEKELRQL